MSHDSDTNQRQQHGKQTDDHQTMKNATLDGNKRLFSDALNDHSYARLNMGVKFYVHNVFGLKKKLYCPDFVDLLSESDVFILSETKLDDADSGAINDILLKLGFDVHMKNRAKITSHKSGGILVGIKREIAKYCRIIESRSKACLWFILDKQLFGLDQDVLYGAVYIPPEGTKYADLYRNV